MTTISDDFMRQMIIPAAVFREIGFRDEGG
jgi:hypothetical protein